MFKVVLDTNVYISSFVHPKGRVAKVWRARLEGRYHILISPAIIREIAGVLRNKFDWQEKRLIARLKKIVRCAVVVTPTITLNAITSDPDDNRVLECAVEGKADLIVSGDQDLHRLETYEGIPIVTPLDFLRTLGIN